MKPGSIALENQKISVRILETPSWTTYTYDAYGRVSSVNYPDTTSTSYDYDSLETTITLRTGSDTITTRTKMNVWGELVESEDNIGNTVFNSYYPEGKLKRSWSDRPGTRRYWLISKMFSNLTERNSLRTFNYAKISLAVWHLTSPFFPLLWIPAGVQHCRDDHRFAVFVDGVV